MENTAIQTTKPFSLPKHSKHAISDTLREQMYRLYRDTRNMSHVARVCHVRPATVKKYSQLDNWVERMALDKAHADGTRGTLELKDTEAEVTRALADVRRSSFAEALKLSHKTAREATMTAIDCAKMELELKGRTTAKDCSLMASAAEKLARLEGLRRKREGKEVKAGVVENKACETEPETPQIEGK